MRSGTRLYIFAKERRRNQLVAFLNIGGSLQAMRLPPNAFIYVEMWGVLIISDDDQLNHHYQV